MFTAQVAAGFERSDVIQIAELAHQRVDFFAEKGLSSCDAHVTCGVRLYAFDDIRRRHFLTFIIGVLSVTVGAAQVTSAGPNEHSRIAGETGFALNAKEDLINFQHNQAVLQPLREIQTFKVVERPLN